VGGIGAWLKNRLNYVSGFIILLTGRRLGDMITADNHYGEVTKSEPLRGGAGTYRREVIIPNDTLVTTTVQNHSYPTAACGWW
jgi:small-conductance mechanosensitive channel